MTYSSEVLADSPLGYWRLGEASGATTVDASGNSRDLAYSGSVTYAQASLLPAQADTSIVLSSTSPGKASLADASWMHPTTFSIEAWVKWDGTGPGTTHCIASKTLGGTINATNYQFMLYRPASSNNATIIVCNTGGTNVTLAESAGNLTSGATRHIVATFDGTNVKLYVDGSQVGSTALSGSLATSPTSALVLGDISTGARAWGGGLDEAAYYGTALSAARVLAHYNVGKGNATGTLASTLGPATLAASGTVTSSGVTGTLATTLAGATLAASGTETITGTAASTLAGATLAASGGETFVGTLATTLAAATLAASGTETVTGSFAATLGGATLAATGVESITGTFSTTLAGASLDASGSVDGGVTGTLIVTLEGAALSASGVETIGGTFAVTLADATLAATGSSHQPFRDVKVYTIVDRSRVITITDQSRDLTPVEHPRELVITDRSL